MVDEYILEVAFLWLTDKRLRKQYVTPDIYVMVETSKLVESGDMSDKVGADITKRIKPVLTNLLIAEGVV